MQLTRTERWILSNQMRILEALYPDEEQSFRQHREALEFGYELHYQNGAPDYIEEDNYVLSTDECLEVLDILNMYRAIHNSYLALQDKTGISEESIRFDGFDGNEETKQFGYCRYFCSLDGGRFTELGSGDDNYNSHGHRLDSYRRMLREWTSLGKSHNLAKDDIARIVQASYQPREEM